MASTLKLEIVTPEAKVYSEEVDSVRLPGAEGELGIYPTVSYTHLTLPTKA